MRRADRLFDILQILRTAKHPTTAASLAGTLEVTVRTIYRDVAALQAARVPIEGAPGLGYVLRQGFDLPPLMFTADEIDAITVGARMVRRLRDAGLQRAAESVLAKVATALPAALRGGLGAPPFLVSDGDNQLPEGIDLSALRLAIREERKVVIDYADAEGCRTKRTLWPLAMAYYVDVTLLGAWCELRADFRNFRVERILASEILTERFPADGGSLTRQWFARQTQHVRDAALAAHVA
jgi:predicted DNA-binding transcriptional regulator YafY